MNSLKLGWIDYSGEHRNKVMAVLDALSSPGALDELGIGLIRDRLADILFPGMLTIADEGEVFLYCSLFIDGTRKKRVTNHRKELIEKLRYRGTYFD
ncbi:DUF6361 family protein [Peribacillus frigoritolerans]|nr:DUF6361 family protein [Peribacillus frigoritolerans]